MSDESFLFQLKRALVGAPIHSDQAHHERLSRVTGLAVLSSDALSSVAYATEEILRVLLVGGVAALSLVTPIGITIAVTPAIVVFRVARRSPIPVAAAPRVAKKSRDHSEPGCSGVSPHRLC